MGEATVASAAQANVPEQDSWSARGLAVLRGLALALSPCLVRARGEDRLALCPGGAVLVPQADQHGRAG